jgi:hypothetical protein
VPSTQSLGRFPIPRNSCVAQIRQDVPIINQPPVRRNEFATKWNSNWRSLFSALTDLLRDRRTVAKGWFAAKESQVGPQLKPSEHGGISCFARLP